ncbi:SDR family oxidoreductase [Actinoplanes couchii]|uniref:Short-chain dehydrogenase n=1 Tax=Actinoplanes couchii TaxID=403638 RepID=A0ABQ3XN60_9ACTN|nr:SDR family oxidoreductase [Actinoplanes couchii]MDR6318155.1 NAD(P)-dependent dehydrogenase (short-subunit alcohol dehydrogenase family) [Actinoplanes couchii]GID59929.1 short-chain dehydrogenase [Actinoplanes couchii]
MSTSVVIGGTAGLGRFVAGRHAGRGDTVVIAGRDAAKAGEVAREMGPTVTGIAVDLARPHTIAESLRTVERVDRLVITAAFQKPSTLTDFDIDEAVIAVTTKLVGYTEAIRVLRDRFGPSASVVVFGGLAKERPYPGSTVITTFNSAITGLIKTLALELAPHRINALHPALVGDSPRWAGADLGHMTARTPIGRLITMDEVADAVDFLLDNGAMNAHDLFVDGGVLAQ